MTIWFDVVFWTAAGRPKNNIEPNINSFHAEGGAA
jgi:hypothetical protein